MLARIMAGYLQSRIAITVMLMPSFISSTCMIQLHLAKHLLMLLWHSGVVEQMGQVCVVVSSILTPVICYVKRYRVWACILQPIKASAAPLQWDTHTSDTVQIWRTKPKTWRHISPSPLAPPTCVLSEGTGRQLFRGCQALYLVVYEAHR